MTREEACERHARFENGAATVAILEKATGKDYGMFDAESHLIDLGFNLRNGYPTPQEVEKRLAAKKSQAKREQTLLNVLTATEKLYFETWKSLMAHIEGGNEKFTLITMTNGARLEISYKK